MSLKRVADRALSIAAVLGVVGIMIGIGVAFFGVTPLVFKSGSMSPAIETGDLAFARHVDVKDIKKGDVVSVHVNGARVTHRVVAVDGDQLTLKGDANNVVDEQPVTVAAADRVFMHVPKLGYPIAWASTPVGLIVAGALAALLLFVALRPAGRDEDSDSDSRTAGRGVAVAAGAAAVVVASTTTLAYWTDNANLTSPVSSGTLVIQANASTAYTWTFPVSTLSPGDAVAAVFPISNGGTIPLKFTATGRGQGDLTTLTATVTVGTNAAATNGTSGGVRTASCSGVAGANAVAVSSTGTTSDVITAPQTLLVGESTNLCVRVSLPSSSTQWSKPAQLRFTFNAKQVNAS